MHFSNYVRGSVGRLYVEFSSKMLTYLFLLTVIYLLFYMKKFVLLA